MRFLTIALLLIATPASAEDIVGRVVGVLDGDTVMILRSGAKTVRVRLAEIDAPEKAQPYGGAARQMLSSLLFGKQVVARVQDHDRWQRPIARISVAGVDINGEMVRRGGAWRYVAYTRDGMFVEYEAAARASRAGLWALPPAQRMAPWEWRRAHGEGVAAGRTVPPARHPGVGVTPADVPVARSSVRSNEACSPRRYCSQLSCAEAYRYLSACGPEGIDGDGDGKPCERQCGH